MIEASQIVDFFISRAGADQSLAKIIVETLETAGYSCILQDWDFGGADFVAKMDDALARSKRLITLLSDAYQNSEFCGAEWRAVFAQSRGDTRNFDQRLILFRVSECMPRGILCVLAYTDLVPLLGSPEMLREVVLARVDPNRPRKATDSASLYCKAALSLLHPKVQSVPNFTDRTEVFAEIDQALVRSDKTAAINAAAVYGLGGVGKSALAREFGWRNQDRYSGVWWIDATNVTEIENCLIKLGAKFISDLDKCSDRREAAYITISQILPAWERPWLLIYDNVEDETSLENLLPIANADVLVTSSFEAYSQRFVKVPLKIFNREDSKRYLRAQSNRTELDADYDLLACDLGDLPLPLSLAAAYLLNNSAVTIEEYRESLSIKYVGTPNELKDQKIIFATYQAAIERLDPEATGAAVIMHLVAFLAPNDIPVSFFKQDANIYPQAIRSLVQHKLSFGNALSQLHRYSLVHLNEERKYFSLHRLVQAAIRAKLQMEEQTWIAHILTLFRSYLNKHEIEKDAEVALFKGVTDVRGVIPHLVHFCNTAIIPDGEETADTIRMGAEAALRVGLIYDSLFLAQAANRALGGNLGESDISLDVRLTLMTALKTAGDDEYLQQAYKLGLETIKKLDAYCNRPTESILKFKVHHADTIDRLGLMDEANMLLKEVLEIRKRKGDETSAEYHRTQLLLANVLRKAGKLDEALCIQQEIVQIRRESLGISASETLTAMLCLAGTRYEMNDFLEAERLERHVVEQRKQALKESDPETLTAMSNLALSLRALSKYGEAVCLHRKVLDHFINDLGETHSDTRIAMRHLADSLYLNNEYKEARIWHRKMLDYYATIMDLKHYKVSEVAYYVWVESCVSGMT